MADARLRLIQGRVSPVVPADRWCSSPTAWRRSSRRGPSGDSRPARSTTTPGCWTGCWPRWAARRGRSPPRMSTGSWVTWRAPGGRRRPAVTTCRYSRVSTGSWRSARRSRSRLRSGSGWFARWMSTTLPAMSAAIPRSQDPPPAPERVTEFFGFLKARIGTARKYAPAARDYALFRMLYHAGIRCEEAVLLGCPGRPLQPRPVRETARPLRQGRPHIRPRPRWVPMLDGLDLQLRWFVDDVRGRFPGSAALFCDESGVSWPPGRSVTGSGI